MTPIPRPSEDFRAWTQAVAGRLRERKPLADDDLDDLIDELECLGRHERHSVEHYLEFLFVLFLKWRNFSELRDYNLKMKIKYCRRKVLRALKDSPRLWEERADCAEQAYPGAVYSFCAESDLVEEAFPSRFATTGWPVDKRLEEDFFPRIAP